jgi:hypothetical protein
LGISSVTGAMNTQSSSQNNINYNISVVTASIDVHILKQATQTGSQDLVNLGISTFTGSQNIINSSVDSHILKQATQTGSQDIVNFNISVVTASIDNHILKQATQTGSQDLVNLGISTFTGSIQSEVSGIEAYTASLKGVAIVSSSQQITNYYKFAETSSANTFYGNQTISGSLNVSGSTNLTGSVNVSGSTTFNGVHTLSGSNTIVGNTLMTGTNTIIGNTQLSGSIDVSGSSNFHNSIFIVTGSQFYTGSSDFKGNQTITGSLNVTGNINVESGSGFYYYGNKLFNRGQFYHTATLSGSANTAYPFQYNTTDTSVTNGTVYVDNDSRIYVKHSGIYNVQFSAQLHTTANEACDFSVWFAMTGSNIMDSNTDYSIEKVSGGGYAVAALNYLTHIQSGSYIELYYSKTTANGQIQAKGTQSTPTRPATPSIIVTVTQVA